MRSVLVQFPSGREVLTCYWGFLSKGGLVLHQPKELPEDVSEGEALVLDVKIKSLKQSYRFAAKLVRRAPENTHAFVAFDEGQDPETMLNAAWADTHEVPQRKHRRFPMASAVFYSAPDALEHAEGQLLNVSRGGCCVKGTVLVPVGSRVKVSALGLEIVGKVRWSTPGCQMGIEFLQPGVEEALLHTA
jgi:hypothetical protein